MENKKDLQDVFEASTLETLNKISEILEQKELSEPEAEKIFDIISSTWFEETGKKLSRKSNKLKKIFENYQLLLYMHIGIRRGQMTMNGRLKLSDPNSATFHLSERGVNYVENKILNK
ncbi:MAG TPA: hypothetical protein VGZ90_13605 [Puia sp.]|jgi:hypothetical protein|nr:hypothetical protein [Puia sp.]